MCPWINLNWIERDGHIVLFHTIVTQKMYTVNGIEFCLWHKSISVCDVPITDLMPVPCVQLFCFFSFLKLVIMFFWWKSRNTSQTFPNGMLGPKRNKLSEWLLLLLLLLLCSVSSLSPSLSLSFQHILSSCVSYIVVCNARVKNGSNCTHRVCRVLKSLALFKSILVKEKWEEFGALFQL